MRVILISNKFETHSILPPGSADISQIANIRWGKEGAPTLDGNQGV